jgi:DNA-binding transcriptional LysR family regulator
VFSETPYGLARPTMDDARAAVHRVHAGDGPRVWAGLLRAAGTDGTGEHGLDRLIAAMRQADPVSRLCALALTIRLDAHSQLSLLAKELS